VPFFFLPGLLSVPCYGLFCIFSCLPASPAPPARRESGCGCVGSGHVLGSAVILLGVGRGRDWQRLCGEREGSENTGDHEGSRVLWLRTAFLGDGASGGHLRAREGGDTTFALERRCDLEWQEAKPS